jgi:hypothetical protein
MDDLVREEHCFGTRIAFSHDDGAHTTLKDRVWIRTCHWQLHGVEYDLRSEYGPIHDERRPEIGLVQPVSNEL